MAHFRFSRKLAADRLSVTKVFKYDFYDSNFTFRSHFNCFPRKKLSADPFPVPPEVSCRLVRSVTIIFKYDLYDSNFTQISHFNCFLRKKLSADPFPVPPEVSCRLVRSVTIIFKYDLYDLDFTQIFHFNFVPRKNCQLTNFRFLRKLVVDWLNP